MCALCQHLQRFIPASFLSETSSAAHAPNWTRQEPAVVVDLLENDARQDAADYEIAEKLAKGDGIETRAGTPAAL